MISEGGNPFCLEESVAFSSRKVPSVPKLCVPEVTPARQVPFRNCTKGLYRLIMALPRELENSHPNPLKETNMFPQLPQPKFCVTTMPEVI